MPQIIVVDASCLIILEKIRELDILQKMYGEVFITREVANEYGLPLPDWIKIDDINVERHEIALKSLLDPGEKSVIVLAKELKGLAVLDDLKARKFADKLQVDYTGTMGLIVEAKQNGFIESVRTVLDKIDQTNFRISSELRANVLNMTGE